MKTWILKKMRERERARDMERALPMKGLRFYIVQLFFDSANFPIIVRLGDYQPKFSKHNNLLVTKNQQFKV